MSSDLVVISWNGRGEPHGFVEFDQPPRFRLVTFDYSGSATAPLSRRTECKGQIFDEVATYVREGGESFDYVGLIDDDVLIKISDINHMLRIARVLELDAFAPSLSHDSRFSHKNTLRIENRVAHRVPWVEVMAPFYRSALFLAAAPRYRHSISSWGIDCYLMPMFQKIMGMENVAVIDAVMAAHFRPIASQERRYSNGLTAAQEAERLRLWCRRYIAEHHPDLAAGAWFDATYGDMRSDSGPPQ